MVRMTSLEKTRSGRLQLTQIGEDPDAVGIIFPDEMVARMKLKPGDTLHVRRTPDGGISLIKAGHGTPLNDDSAPAGR